MLSTLAIRMVQTFVVGQAADLILYSSAFWVSAEEITGSVTVLVAGSPRTYYATQVVNIEVSQAFATVDVIADRLCPKVKLMDGWKKNKATGYLAIIVVLIPAGCKENRPEATTSGDKKSAVTPSSDQGHSHERGKMLLADVGDKYHALLTAHLSPMGNELDIFFETQDDKNPTPTAVPLGSFKAFVTVVGSEQQPKELTFEPAPIEERPKSEKAGTSSHFVAKAPWMKPSDTLSVVATIAVDGERYRVTWDHFNPKKYAHHEE